MSWGRGVYMPGAKQIAERPDFRSQGTPMRMQQQVSTMSHVCVFAALLGALVLVGCSRKVGPSDVLGTYVANRDKGVDVLEVKKDGTYFYTCKLGKAPDFANTAHWTNSSPDVSDFTSENHWSLHYEDGEPRVTFDNFRFCARDYRRLAGFWDVSVQSSWTGAMRLPIDRDVNSYFVKNR